MQIKQLSFAALAALLLSVVACNQSTQTSNINQITARPNNTAVSQREVKTKDPKVENQSNPSSGSPTDALKSYIRALKEADVMALKRTLSKKSLEMIATSAKAQKKPVDEVLKKGDGSFLENAVEFRNEKIENDAASVEARNPAGETWLKMPLVKEEGEWKMAFDKIMEDLDVPDASLKLTTPSTALTPADIARLAKSRPKPRTAKGLNKTVTTIKLSDGVYTKTESIEDMPLKR